MRHFLRWFFPSHLNSCALLSGHALAAATRQFLGEPRKFLGRLFSCFFFEANCCYNSKLYAKCVQERRSTLFRLALQAAVAGPAGLRSVGSINVAHRLRRPASSHGQLAAARAENRPACFA